MRNRGRGVALRGRGFGAAPGWTPAALAGLAPTVQVARSRAAGLVWQDAAKTVPATADGDPVRVITCPDTGVDYTAPSDAARPLLWAEGGGKWSLSFDGVDDRLQFSTAAVAQPFVVGMRLRAYTGGTDNVNLYRAESAQAVGYRSGGLDRYTVYAGNAIDSPETYAADGVRVDYFAGAASSITGNGTTAAGDAGTQGLNTGPADPVNVGAGTGGGSAAAVRLAAFVPAAAPTAGDRAALAAYLAAL